MRPSHRMTIALLGLALTAACTRKPGDRPQPISSSSDPTVAAKLAAWEPVDKGFTGCAGG